MAASSLEISADLHPVDLQQRLMVDQQCLAHLGQRLNEWVTAHLEALHEHPKEKALQPEIEEVWQILVAALNQSLAGEAAAIFRREPVPSIADSLSDPCLHRLSQRPLEAPFVLTHLAPESVASSGTFCFMAGTEGIALQPGMALSQQNLQHLSQQFPQNLWQILDHTDLVGWLLVGKARLSGDRDPSLDNGDRRTQFIQQAIQQSVVAWHQVQLIHAQCQRQKDLVAHNQDLEQANKLKSEFLANTSHEIRTPLSSILGFTHLLREQGFNPMNQRHQDYLNIILTSGQHLLALINDILDLSKIEANQLDLHWEAIAIRALCQTVITLVKEKASDKGLRLKLEIAAEVDCLTADPLRLKQMLFNLLSNAIKFTVHGTVGLTVAPVDGYLRFTVWDTGTGISEEQQALLFRPYSQIENVAVQPGEGTGLGLALTQKLAELHGGWIEVHSQLHHGSQFTIVLPLVSPKVGIQEPSSDTELGSGGTTTAAIAPTIPASPMVEIVPTSPTSASIPAKAVEKTSSKPVVTSSRPNHVLLVEDNPSNARLLLTYLSKLGYELTWVKSGQEMWQALERSLPVLILMDICLPGEDGLDLTRQLKANSRYAKIPVIAQTAMAMNGDRAICLEAGVSDYISKPVDLDTLKQLVSKYVAGRE